MATIDKATVKAAREKIQSDFGLGITDAQTFCATLIHKKLRAWQQWEEGSRQMDLALFELFKIKTGAIKTIEFPALQFETVKDDKK